MCRVLRRSVPLEQHDRGSSDFDPRPLSILVVVRTSFTIKSHSRSIQLKFARSPAWPELDNLNMNLKHRFAFAFAPLQVASLKLGILWA